ncbi:SMI1/KNR4 family protein [Streptomyces sp. NPDC048277]|uniref:SMI1/KNR4 family protein n=1 Tax=Streptomyces sp. NPDC048277 TaxID=3155027 RepID=UPI0033F97960
MTDTIEDWRSFLARWSREWADAQDQDVDAPTRDEEPLRTGWLGFPAASEERLGALEERLGHRLPPSYRAFLAVSDGWRHAGGFVWLLAGTDRVRWHEDAAGLSEYFPGELDEDPTPEDVLLAGMWGRALQLDVESDAVYVLLDPGDVDEAGEWAVYTWASWHGDVPTRYGSFRTFMEAMYREFHSLEASRSKRAGREFVNATTRALDATVEAARLDALGGRYERAATALAEAVAHGRPRAAGMRDQIRRLLGQTYMVSFHGLADGPLYAREIVPVLVAEHARMRRDEDLAARHLPGASDAVREAADEVLRRIRDGSFRSTAEGAFGRAVEEAREQARWGETDAAWHTLRAALPGWRPLSPDHLAPVGLCADPLLGPLITPERGRELLATPRAGEPGDPPPPTADLDPPGLAWLADVDSGRLLSSYRFLLVEGVEPAELPSLIGVDESAVLNDPATLWDARTRFRRTDDIPPWADVALTAVGRAGPGWSFAFEAAPGGSPGGQRFVSPGLAASRGTRTVTVWSEPSRAHRPGVFHLSVAENGEERYGLTVGGTATDSRGTVPDALRPDLLFPPDAPAEDRRGERRALGALAGELGVRLPRFALTQGRLHTFRTRSWNRAPGPGEAYVTIGFARLRP